MKLDLIWKEGTIWINIKIAYINDLNDPMVGPAMKCREHDIEIYKREAHHWQVTSLFLFGCRSYSMGRIFPTRNRNR